MKAAASPVTLAPRDRRDRRDRAVTLIALLAVAAVAWNYLLHVARGMSAGAPAAGLHMPQMQMPATLDLFSLFVMWAVMMVAMMLPSTVPMVLLVATVNRQRRARASSAVPTAVFVGGYVAVWTVFSAAAALTQSWLHRGALLAPTMASASPMFSGVLLLIAGTYQWLPIKNACLGRCRSPLEWREGWAGAIVMGFRHGLFCLGCCWALMALLFVAGVMNVVWIAMIAALVLLEKLAPNGPLIARATGTVFLAWGAYLIAAP